MDHNPPTAIAVKSLGKMYKLYRRPADKILDAFGLDRWFFWRRNVYQEFWALRNLALEVRQGERVGIIGRNGAGKSTLLKIITGNVSPTEGTVSVRGRIQALMELGTGFHPEFTGRQNIRASLAYQGLTQREIAGKEEEIIDFAELDMFIDQPIKTYSAGMYARLAFSTATAVDPDVLIIDEVLGAGDAYFASKCVERMKRLTEETGATVLFVSHDLGSVQQMCGRVVWIDRGRVVEDGDPLTVTKQYYAAVLQREEQRLRRRNARAQCTASAAKADEPHGHELLGRFVAASGGALRGACPVRRLVLRRADGYQMVLEPGTPMDNDLSQAAYLLTDPEFMYWSEPRLYQDCRVRCVEDTGGRYQHAPFVFRIPYSDWQQGGFVLMIEHAVRVGMAVAVQLYEAQTYRTLGLLESAGDDWQTQSWPVHASADPGALAQPAAVPTVTVAGGGEPSEGSVVLLARGVDKFYSDFAELLDLRFMDASGRAKVIFGLAEGIGLAAEAEVFRDLCQCAFCISIYTLNSVVVANLYWPITGGLVPGRYRWQLSMVVPNLRQGEYLVSGGLIKEYATTSNEAVVFYCRWSKAVSFRVEETYIGNMPLGIVHMQTHPPAGNPLTPTTVPPSARTPL